MIRVTMQFGGKPVKKFTFDKEMVTIGRDHGCDIVIENIGASRRHAMIQRTEEGYVLADLKSHNGTFVGGEKVFHHQLTDSDEFFIGKYAFVFEQLDPVLEVDDGIQDEQPQIMPDMTFRLDRKEIDKIIQTSVRGAQTQLVQLAPESAKRSLSLEKQYYVVGGDENAEIKLTGWFAPSKAAVLVKSEHGWRVLCLSSRFKVNGKHVADGAIADGDLLSCGKARFRFCQA